MNLLEPLYYRRGSNPETTAASYNGSFLNASGQNDHTQMQEAIKSVADDLGKTSFCSSDEKEKLS